MTAAQGLTYGLAKARASLWADALRYSTQYDCLNVFPSSGPLILRWPWCGRLTTLRRRAVRHRPQPHGRADLRDRRARGLREIRIYDGERLFRRFVLNGEQVFSTVLHLEASVQRNLVLVAEDRGGGEAVSVARRSWKDGSLTPVFCSDRINDCGNMFLARGPFPMAVLRTPGGRRRRRHLGRRAARHPDADHLRRLEPRCSSPIRAAINGDQYNQTPLLRVRRRGRGGRPLGARRAHRRARPGAQPVAHVRPARAGAA